MSDQELKERLTLKIVFLEEEKFMLNDRLKQVKARLKEVDARIKKAALEGLK